MAKRKLSVSKKRVEGDEGAIEAEQHNDNAKSNRTASPVDMGLGAIAGNQTRKAQEDMIESIMSGRVALMLDPERVHDTELGSDRHNDWQNNEKFKQLLEGIQRRGQTTAIQVAPDEVGWKPDYTDSGDLELGTTTFKVISGRRRLEACRRLGIDVKAVIMTAVIESDAPEIAALEERFEENANREDLSGLDYYYSLGHLASRIKDEEGLSQTAIGGRLQVSQSDVSRAKQVFERYEELREFFGGRATTISSVRAYVSGQYEKALRLTDTGEGQEANTPETGTGHPQSRSQQPTLDRPEPLQLKNDGKLHVRPTKKGNALTIRAEKVSIPQDKQKQFESELKKLFDKYAK